MPLELQAVCLKAMAKRPEDRYQTAVEVRQDLERFRAGQPVSQAATTRVVPPPFDGGSTAVLGPPVTATRTTRYAEPPPRSRRWLAWVLVPLGLVGLTVAVALLITRLVQPAPQAAGPPTFPTATTTPATSAPPTTQAPTTTEAPTTAPPTTAAPTTQPPTSGGPAQVRVPDVRGRRPNVARNILQRLGLQVREFDIPTGDPRNLDRVIVQQPVNTEVPRGTVVNIGVGRRLGG